MFIVLTKVQIKSSSNAASVYSEHQNGTLGILALTVLPAIYTTLAGLAFVHPTNQGRSVVIPERSIYP